MKTERLDGSAQRKVLVGMITDRAILARIAARWNAEEGLFGAPHENMIAGWCIRHFRKYDKAPGRDIENIYAEWASNRDHDETSKMIDRFLSSLSAEYEAAPCSSEYVIDLAAKHFDRVAAKKLLANIEGALERDDLEAVKSKINQCRWVDLGGSSVITGHEYDVWQEAFEGETAQALIEYPGELGEFVGGEFARDSFVAFMASSKRGKTWWLIDLAYRAMKKRRRVAYFEAGDLSRNQLMRRFGIRTLRRPRYTRAVSMPVSYESAKDGPEIQEQRREAATPNEAFKEWQKITQGEQFIRIRCYSTNTLTTAVMDETIKEWARDGWVADVVIIDYADLLAPPVGMRADERESINENWKYMRRISQDLHCLVVTATQADAESYDRKLLSRRNFSGDRRKHDHVTAMLALNATDEDKRKGVTRVNFLDRRDSEYTETAQVYVAGCLDIGCPVLKSTRWRNEEEGG